MFKCGASQTDITPPMGVPMAGYGKRTSGSEGVHDPIMARAIVLDNGTRRIGWVITDLIGLTTADTDGIRDAVSKSCGIAVDSLMVSSTHTHGGPDTKPQEKAQADHEAHKAYLKELPGKIIQCVSAAAEGLAPARVSFGRATLDKIQHNRRYHMTDGTVLMDWDDPDPAKVAYLSPVDPAVQALVINSDSGVRAVLVQFACHSTVMDSGNRLITADWPGAACRHLQSLLTAGQGAKGQGPWVAVAQGCCGDINPDYPKDTFDEVDAKGHAVAEAAKRAVERAEPAKGDDLKAVILPVRLPRKNHGFDTTPTGEFYDSQVQGFRIGDVAIVGLPGEVFSGIGLNIKAHSEFRGTFVGSYANDYEPGYIPLSSEYVFGGYEVEYCRVAPGADVAVTAAALETLKGLENR